MAPPRAGLNPTTNSVGMTAKLVTVKSVSADGSTAIVVDRQNTQTQVPMLVQRSKGPLPVPGETWLIAQDLGMWTFAAVSAASGSEFAEGGENGSRITVSPRPPLSPAIDDIWLNSANGNQLAYWDGTTWVAAQLGAAAIAPSSLTAAQMAPATITAKQLAASAGILASQVAFNASQIGGSRVFTGTAQPSGMVVGDLWFDNGNGNTVSVWTGSGWDSLLFAAPAIEPGSLTGAQMSDAASISASQVNFTASDIGGVTVSISAEEPPDPAVGDLWYDATNGFVLKQWNGVTWALYKYGTGAISAGAITAELIAANTITAAQIAAGTVIAGVVNGTVIEGATFLGTNWVENELGSFYYSGTPGPGNLLASIANLPGVDGAGNAYVAGTASYDQTQHVAVSIEVGNVLFYSSATYAGPWSIGPYIQPGPATLQIHVGSCELDLSSAGGIATSAAILAAGGVFAAQPGSGGGVTETWHNVAAASGFSVTTVQRYKLYPDNTVHVQFNLATTNTSGTYNLFTLPAAYVPAQQYDGCPPRIFNTTGTFSSTLLNTGFRVTTGGVVQLVDLPGTAINEVSGYYVIPLD